MDGHRSVQPSVTVSMDVTIAMSIPDHPWIDTTLCTQYPSDPVSMDDVIVAVTVPEHPWMDTALYTPLSQYPWTSQLP